ncbi:MAG TPA: bifunctional UDP-N-acetylglucosamine diphosphorylase/glucosamine-1-phosphate N-acetyltransferase GlmU [Bryobacteraceae bacterium]|nr:bifunctional UDP-N-acetylglucosamine diphosphorylase/glucosamine-1-phosphate N-acetyltransferase GlmU [Bryobacteraceae bacterium]
MEPVTVVILAAGLGTRMKSRKAKVLHGAGGLTLVENVINTAAQVTPEENIVVVVGHQADQVRAALSHRRVQFVEQTEQKGTGHAVMMCASALRRSGLVAILYGDTPLLPASTLKALIDKQRDSGTAATLITTRLDDPSGYGRVLLNERGFVHAIVEHKAATPEQLAIPLINSGMYCFRADVLCRHIGEIRPDNPAKEYYLTDIVEILNRTGQTVAALEIADASELLGINTRVELAAADRILRRRKAVELMLSGVTIENPETVAIDAQVTIGIDTVVHPFARILGNTHIGEECLVGAGAVIQDSNIGRRVEIGPYTLIAASNIGDEARVGPFSRLRLDNEVGAGAHIGNFVELKKTRMGAGAKANHLAYLGDSNIGDKTNIGAGTITCNYDGAHKHKTEIGRGVFVGSNATLVAPIEIGDGSYVGAGSVITDPVPADALALGRGRQVIKEGWAARRKR